jgi:hypothetical protein
MSDGDLQALQQQLEEARDEAELNLLQLQQVQEELEFYFLRCQELDREIEALKQAPPAPAAETAESLELANLREILAQTQAQLEQLQSQRQQEQHLLSTAQAMLEGQARYLEDVSLREENAAQAIDRLRLLEAEILYYLRHSRPLASLDPDRINRLVQLAKQPSTSA